MQVVVKHSNFFKEKKLTKFQIF